VKSIGSLAKDLDLGDRALAGSGIGQGFPGWLNGGSLTGVMDGGDGIRGRGDRLGVNDRAGEIQRLGMKDLPGGDGRFGVLDLAGFEAVDGSHGGAGQTPGIPGGREVRGPDGVANIPHDQQVGGSDEQQGGGLEFRHAPDMSKGRERERRAKVLMSRLEGKMAEK
jgi:hypothetical protein